MDPQNNPALTVGRRLVELCQQGQWEQAIVDLYGEEAVHVESVEMGPDMPREVAGKASILEMHEQWDKSNDVHSCEIVGPFPHGEDRFAVVMRLDLTPQAGPMEGQRHTMEEVCVYHLAGTQIGRVEFFYDITGYGQ